MKKNMQIKKIRKEIENLIKDPEFEKMSKAFRHTLAQRLGIKDLKEGGLVIQAGLPFTLRDVLEDAGIPFEDSDDFRIKLINQVDKHQVAYGNVYSYGFW